LNRRILRLIVYLRRGYSHVAFLVGLANFIVIQYRLLVEDTFLAGVFPSLSWFAAAVVLAGVPALAVLGWLDYRRATMPVEAELATAANPFTRDLVEAVARLLEAHGDRELAGELRRRWSG